MIKPLLIKIKQKTIENPFQWLKMQMFSMVYTETSFLIFVLSLHLPSRNQGRSYLLTPMVHRYLQPD